MGIELGDIGRVDGYQIWCGLCGKFFDSIFKTEARAADELLTHLERDHRTSDITFREGKAYK